MIVWLAGEEWRRRYSGLTARYTKRAPPAMFGVPIERIKKGNPEYELRQKGKVAELALGYQGSVGAMRQMDTGNQLADPSDDDVTDIVTRWSAIKQAHSGSVVRAGERSR